MFSSPTLSLDEILNAALAEDCPQQDVTTEAFIPEDAENSAKIIAKAKGVFCGNNILVQLFGKMSLNAQVQDGDLVEPGDCIAQLTGSYREILLKERVALNFLQRLSGIATTTAQYVRALGDPNIKILDTRKTTPLFRALERQAVEAGGGYNHRWGLSDMMLIKENHLAYLKKTDQLDQFESVLAGFQNRYPDLGVEVEVDDLDLLAFLPLDRVDVVMLDNFSIPDCQKAIDLCRHKGYRKDIEVSGNVTLDTIHQFAGLGIQRISVGSLTHSVKALDLSMICDD